MAKLIDGRRIRDEIKSALKKEVTQLASLGRSIKLGVVYVGDNAVSAKYIGLKEKFGEDIGVEVQVFEYDGSISEEDLAEEVARLAGRSDISGLIIQLPLPKHINSQKILDLIPGEKDVDALGAEPKVLSPVVLTVKQMLEDYKADYLSKKVVVVGNGKLVGRPVSVWLAGEGADVVVLNSKSENISETIKHADILISGTGNPDLLKPEMIKEGAVIIDAGTSGDNGKLVGDVSKDCAERASLITPVPGGVGTVTLAMLFKNLIDLTNR